jgi:hypothetical protein
MKPGMSAANVSQDDMLKILHKCGFVERSSSSDDDNNPAA